MSAISSSSARPTSCSPVRRTSGLRLTSQEGSDERTTGESSPFPRRALGAQGRPAKHVGEAQAALAASVRAGLQPDGQKAAPVNQGDRGGEQPRAEVEET